MNYYNASGQMDLSDRIAIETGICIGESFKKIAKRLRRHPSTIAHEVKENRTFIKGNYPNGKDCRMARQCTVRNLCGCDEEACNTKCRLCRGVDCTKVCDRYEDNKELDYHIPLKDDKTTKWYEIMRRMMGQQKGFRMFLSGKHYVVTDFGWE